MSGFAVIAPHPPILLPEVGGARSGVTAASATALERAAGALAYHRPDSLVLISPHAPALADAFVVDGSQELTGSLAQFGSNTPRTQHGDPQLAAAILDVLNACAVRACARDCDPRLRSGWLDHASLVPLHFLDPSARYPLVVVSLSGQDHESHRLMGEAILTAAISLGRRVGLIASGDLSHRLTPDAPAGYHPDAARLDQIIVELIEAGDTEGLSTIDPGLVEAGGECGLRSIIAAGGFCGGGHVPSRVLAYEGPWGVGYLTALLGSEAVSAHDHVASVMTSPTGSRGGRCGEAEPEIVSLARDAVVSHVSGHPLASTHLESTEYPRRAGVFVSLYRAGDLRGCIGTIVPTAPTLAEEVCRNAVQAASNDPRFPPLSSAELEDLEVSVDVLHGPEPATSNDLDPDRFGVIVSSGWRRGLLLPRLEGVTDVTTQLNIALRKAGIDPAEPYTVERFTVDRYR